LPGCAGQAGSLLQALVGLERLGLAARAVEGEHQLAAEALAEWMVGDERLELSDEVGVTTEREVGLDQVFEGDETKFFESGSFASAERLRGELGQGGATPKFERPAKRLGSCRRLPADERLMAPRELALEAMEVELL
jgi:hypothetical protein